MSNPFLAEVVMFGGNFAPRSWAFCDGQLLSISQNQALFSLLGTIYGGDGRTTFALPDLRGRSALGSRRGPGLSDRRQGARGGTQTNNLTVATIPSHNHGIVPRGSTDDAGEDDPTGHYPATGDFYAAGNNLANMGANTTGATGSNQAVNNMQPWLAINFIIAIQGTFPSRN